MATRRPIIKIKKDSVQAICNELHISRATVFNALNYSTSSETAQQVRRLALSVYGGVKATKVIW